MIPTFRTRPSPGAFFLFLFSTLVLATIAGPAMAKGTPESFADLTEKLSPTVINIYTTQKVKAPSLPEQFMFPDMENMPEPFRRFFNFPHPQGPGNENGHPREFKRTSLGSGVIISADGYIITNNHVVKDADEINVTLASYDEYQAKIIGRDAKTDLALIKIEPKEALPFATFGNSDTLRVGDWVLAIGNPFGLEQTVTAGIVSAKGRAINSETYGNFIQTDASINPGNSGGPLFDLDGNMVGINTAIFSNGGGNIGIGFAIPINMANNVVKQLKEHGTVTRGWLGVMIQKVSPDLAKEFKLDRPIGALVGDVSPEGPAAKAGVKQGDIITHFQGKEVGQMSMLPPMVAQTPVGENAVLDIVRNGKKMKITVAIGKLDEEDDGSGTSPESAPSQELGFTVQGITPELADSLGIEQKSGVIVSNVNPGSPASEAGIRRGDIILEANRKQIKSLGDFKTVVKERKKDDSLLLLVQRDKHTRFVVLKGN